MVADQAGLPVIAQIRPSLFLDVAMHRVFRKRFHAA